MEKTFSTDNITEYWILKLDTSACGCRAGSLAGARFRPLPAPPRTLVCDPCSYSCPISAHLSSIYVQIQKIVCTTLLHLEPFRNNSSFEKSAPRSWFFGMYKTLLWPKTKTRSLKHLKSLNFIINPPWKVSKWFRPSEKSAPRTWFFCLYETLLWPETKTCSLEYLKPLTFNINHCSID